MSKNFDVAMALIKFNSAYQDLITATSKIPDLDLTEKYPFYLLDLEALAPAVKQWCLTSAAKLFNEATDVVQNPACLDCRFFNTPLLPDGTCAGHKVFNCYSYPYVPFSKELVCSILSANNVNVESLSEINALVAYMQIVERKKYGKAQES